MISHRIKSGADCDVASIQRRGAHTQQYFVVTGPAHRGALVESQDKSFAGLGEFVLLLRVRYVHARIMPGLTAQRPQKMAVARPAR